MRPAAPAPLLLVIVGPTAAGKTAISLRLAAEFNGEIVSADSRLFYRGMDIGTAKPSAVERARIPHHLIDICEPDETVTLGQYQEMAYRVIDAVHQRGRLPILVGGTGQYVMAVVEGWGIPRVPPHPRLRQALSALGGEELGRWLRMLDPVAAGRLDLRNVRRVIRALEVALIAGRPISLLQRKTPPPYDVCLLGLRLERESLYRRIDARVDQMMAAGLVAEVERLHDAGYGRHLPAMSGLGYRQLWAYLEGELELVEAVERIKFETHRFARQQATWFREDDSRIHWFKTEENAEIAVMEFVRQWLARNRIT
ncbi:MAG: tRNA (adenosine(37)-N6)-dimethylallyltransferase MiaA [Anaerolineae bacterium]